MNWWPFSRKAEPVVLPAGRTPQRDRVDFDLQRFTDALAQPHHSPERRAELTQCLCIAQAEDALLKTRGL